MVRLKCVLGFREKWIKYLNDRTPLCQSTGTEAKLTLALFFIDQSLNRLDNSHPNAVLMGYTITMYKVLYCVQIILIIS